MDTSVLKAASKVMGQAGARARTKLSRIMAAYECSDRIWATRIARYGPTGRKPVDVRLKPRLEGEPANAWLRSWSDWSI